MSAATLSITKVSVYEFPGGGATLSTRVFHLQSASFVGSITVKGRARGTSRTYVAIPYKKRHLNAAVADDSFVSTAITDTSIIEVNDAGLDVALDCTAYTSGTMTVDTDDLVG